MERQVTITATPSKAKTISVNKATVTNEITATPDMSLYYSNLSKQWATKMDSLVVGEDYSSKYYAENAKISAETAKMEASAVIGLKDLLKEDFDGYTESLNDTKNLAIEEINTTSTVAIGNINAVVTSSTGQINAAAKEQTELVASTANKALEDIETLTTNSEQAIETLSEISKQEIEALSNTIKTDANDIINTTRLKMGMTIVLDKVLSFEESQGLALQGTYVYKTAVAGERYGYPDFYQKYVNYKNNATATQTTLGSSTITIYNNANGLKFYDIADKGVIDTFFNSTGVADFYGIDEANERIFLPRNNKFWQFTTNTGDVNNYVEAGLPNITGSLGNYPSWGSGTASGAFTKTTGAAGWKGGVDGVVCTNTLNASRSSSIYGNSNTVQPASSKKLLYYVVGNTVSDTSWVDVVTQVEDGVKDLEDKTQEGIERLKASSNALTTTQITNCILEIPQDIKLELNDGVLTLKAGSKVYVPNGFEDDGVTPKFDEIVIESDLSDTYIDSKPYCFFSTKNGTSHTVNQVATCNSGNTDTGTGWHVWYNTSTNKIIRYNGDGEIIADDCSFPVCIYSGETTITSIDQTFNGMGYIGSTVFVLPNVKGLIPNGRNEDGTLNNIAASTNKMTVITATTEYDFNLVLTPDGEVNPNDDVYTIDDVENNYYYTSRNRRQSLSLAKGTFGSGSVVTSFNPKLPFRAIDYSDKSTISCWAMPSNKYIDLTLGASGSTYTAPANGWVTISKISGVTNGALNIISSVSIADHATGSSVTLLVNAPVKKGRTFTVNYTATGTTNYFRFIYAEGEV